jgi:hypothetical protein
LAGLYRVSLFEFFFLRTLLQKQFVPNSSRSGYHIKSISKGLFWSVKRSNILLLDLKECGDAESFCLEPNASNFAIKSISTNKYVSAGQYKVAGPKANRDQKGDWEYFDIVLARFLV